MAEKKKKISEMTSAEIKKKYPKFEDLPKNLLSGMPKNKSDNFFLKLASEYGPVENFVKFIDRLTDRKKRTKPIIPEGLMKRVDKGIPLTHSPMKSPARRVPTKEELGKASGGSVKKNYAYGGRVARYKK